MDRLTQLNAQLAACVSWIEEARRTLQKAADLAAAQAAEEEGQGEEGEAGAGASGMEVDGEGGEPSAAPSAAVSQGATPEPDSLAAALLAAAEVGAEAEGGGGMSRRSSGVPLLDPLPPFVKPKRRGRQPRFRQKQVGWRRCGRMRRCTAGAGEQRLLPLLCTAAPGIRSRVGAARAAKHWPASRFVCRRASTQAACPSSRWVCAPSPAAIPQAAALRGSNTQAADQALLAALPRGLPCRSFTHSGDTQPPGLLPLVSPRCR